MIQLSICRSFQCETKNNLRVSSWCNEIQASVYAAVMVGVYGAFYLQLLL